MSGSWVETQVPCMLYCGSDLCNCSARWFYEELEEGDYDYEEYDQSLTQDKKERQQNQAYERYLQRLQDLHSIAPPVAGVARSRETCTFQDYATDSASKSNTTLSLP